MILCALAEKYLNIPCSCMTPNPYRMELLGRMIDDFNAAAVIDLTWQACHTYNIESYEVSWLKKRAALLHLESDYSSSDEEILKVRIGHAGDDEEVITVGLDIGSVASKGGILGRDIKYSAVLPTGWSPS